MMDDTCYCRGCGRMLKFIRTQRGAQMPCDSFPVRYLPDADGVLLYREDGTSFRGRIVDAKLCPTPGPGADESVAGGWAWVPHFGRCPHPIERKKKRRAVPKGAMPHYSSVAEVMAEGERLWRERRAKEEYDRRVAEEAEARRREIEDRQMSLFG